MKHKGALSGAAWHYGLIRLAPYSRDHLIVRASTSAPEPLYGPQTHKWNHLGVIELEYGKPSEDVLPASRMLPYDLHACRVSTYDGRALSIQFETLSLQSLTAFLNLKSEYRYRIYWSTVLIASSGLISLDFEQANTIPFRAAE